MAWTGSPQGFAVVKKMGPAVPASHLPTHVGCRSGTLRGPTGYKVVRHGAAQHIARPIPNSSSNSYRRAERKENALDTMIPIQGGLTPRP